MERKEEFLQKITSKGNPGHSRKETNRNLWKQCSANQVPKPLSSTGTERGEGIGERKKEEGKGGMLIKDEA